MASNGIAPCPLFALPGFRLAFIGIDVLHCCDLGITQDLCGNVLWEYLNGNFLIGKTIKERVLALDAQLRAHYKIFRPPSKIDNLAEEMIRQTGKGPKLRAKGAETKGCLPFVVTVAIDMAAKRPTDSKYQSIAACASCLFEFYVLLDQEVFRADAAAEACRRYCLLYSALSEQASDERYWRKKPKMHMFQELAEFQAYDLGHPARFWCYADESFVGMIAKMAMPRGGPRNAAVSARNILDRFRALAQES